MEYHVIETKQFGIEADDPETAVRRHIEGESIYISINYQAQPRPQRGQVNPTAVTAPLSTPTAAQKLENKAKVNAKS